MRLSFQNLKDNDDIVAIVALGCDKLELDSCGKEELKIGLFPKPEIEFDYQETFWAKSSYPAIEITYLAVRKDRRHIGIGEYIIEAVGQRAINSQFNINLPKDERSIIACILWNQKRVLINHKEKLVLKIYLIELLKLSAKI